MEGKQKRNYLSLEQKLKIIHEVESGKSYRVVGALYDIPFSSVQKIVGQKAKLEDERANNTDLSRKRTARSTENDELNALVIEFFKRCRQKNITLSGPILQAKAKEIAVSPGVTDFTASNGWLEKFKKRHDILQNNLCGESADVDMAVVEKWKQELPTIMSGYQALDIFNCDETALFYRQMPTKSLVQKGEKAKGGRLAKERITVMFCCSATGEKLKPVVIGNAARPRAFHRNNIVTQELPVVYRSNKTAWMTGAIFTEWLKSVNHQMKRQRRKIAMLLDNAGCHTDLELSNIRLFKLPPNLTSELQPLDQGIIRSAKAHYRRNMLAHLIAKAEDVESAIEFSKAITVLDAINWITAAWNHVEDMTISKCFGRCGISTTLLKIQTGAPEVDIFEAVPPEMIEAFGDAEEFFTCDDDVVCTDDAGESPEEILEIVMESYSTKMDSKSGAEEEDEEDVETAVEALGAPVIVTYADLEKALQTVEFYAFHNSSAFVESVKNLQCNLAREFALKKRMKAKKQTTLDSFFSLG